MRALVLLVFIFFVNSATATTYYVDSASGKDSWSGKIASPNGFPGTDGPWLTLTKVSGASLAPGDTVLLKCGASWSQTLSIKSSGTAASPITFGAYPTSCATPPQVNGSTIIPASNWTPYSGNIYKATLPLDLISNSTFDTGYGGWTVASAYDDATMSLSTSCAQTGGSCMSFYGGADLGLASSSKFQLNAGIAYTVKFAAKIPSGKTISAIVRRFGPPYNALGLTANITGNGAWQTYSFPFTAKLTADARLDFSVSGGLTIGLDDVRVEPVAVGVLGVFDSGRAINIAHHPNRGYNAQQPDSLYYSIAQDSATTLVGGKNVSTYLTTGSDLQLPAGVTLTAGTSIRIRTFDWIFDERKIASVSGSQINLDQPSSFPLYKGWGYFLTGQLWMLDEPGEYYFDPASKTVYVWMPDSEAPGDRVSIAQLDPGIDISNASYVVVDGIAVRNSGTGVQMLKANNVILRNMTFADILGMGVSATYSSAIEIGTSSFARTGRAAISGGDIGYSLSNFYVHDNDISESGVALNGNVVTSLPAAVVGAVQPGIAARITGNSIRGTSYAGIIPLHDSVVSDNYVENACLVLDDGGAILLDGSVGNNTQINHNTVLHVIGSQAGKPADHFTQAQGIYLDSFTSGATISNNTVIDAYDGIQMHNAANNQVQNNTLYGNRRYQLWLQEDDNSKLSTGDMYGNVISGNRFFPTGSFSPVGQQTLYSTTANFGSYDSNRYFTLVLPRMAEEKWSTGSNAYSFLQWQSATTSSGVPRNLDPHGNEVNSKTLGYTTYKSTGSNIVPNPILASGIAGWTAWNQTSPYGVLSWQSCTPGKCVHYTAGGSKGLVSSPNFSVVQGQWYRLAFDLQGSAAGQKITAIVRNGGGGTASYETVMTPLTFNASTAWQRFSLVFQSSETISVNDPVTGSKGARVDIDGTLPGQAISITNMELVPISAFAANLRATVLVNPTAATVSLDCPLNGTTDAALCSAFVRFSDGQPVYWPYSLAARDSEVIHTVDTSLTDTDGDGIPDSQDACASTPAGLSVNAKGCAFSQSYP